jgi:hypothetical protein
MITEDGKIYCSKEVSRFAVSGSLYLVVASVSLHAPPTRRILRCWLVRLVRDLISLAPRCVGSLCAAQKGNINVLLECKDGGDMLVENLVVKPAGYDSLRGLASKRACKPCLLSSFLAGLDWSLSRC